MAAKPIAYVYRAAFPRELDAPRPAWPLELLDRALTLADVVDVTFADVAGAWSASSTPPLHESRRPVIELVTVSATPAAADAARRRVLAFLAEVKALDGGDELVVTRALVDVDVL